MNTWADLASEESLKRAISALSKNGIEPVVVETGKEAKAKVLSLIAEGSEVMTMTSMTLDAISVSEEINNSGRFKAVRDKLYAMDREAQKHEMNKLGAVHEFAVGSVHAVTEDGSVVIASNTGSQLPAYAYSALNVIWVVGSQKIVKNLDEALKRVNEYVLPLENERARNAYGVGSNVSKLLIVNKEIVPGRITMIIVKEKLGF